MPPLRSLRLALPGPARPADIARAEAELGPRFPAGLTASPLRHDGGGGFGLSPHYDLMSADALRDDWEMLCGIVRDDPELAPYWWDGRLIPFADRIDGGNLFVDTRTGKTGTFDDEDELRLEGTSAWPSYLALLRDTVTALEENRPLRGRRPSVKQGRLDWDSTR
jgi:cell wall assembly regulator SMI1